MQSADCSTASLHQAVAAVNLPGNANGNFNAGWRNRQQLRRPALLRSDPGPWVETVTLRAPRTLQRKTAFVQRHRNAVQDLQQAQRSAAHHRYATLIMHTHSPRMHGTAQCTCRSAVAGYCCRHRLGHRVRSGALFAHHAAATSLNPSTQYQAALPQTSLLAHQCSMLQNMA